MPSGAKIGMRVITLAVGVPILVARKKAVDKIWATARPEGAAREPKASDARWTDTALWAALSAVAVVSAQLLTRRAAEATYRVLVGSEPPESKSKSEKKLEKAQRKKRKKAARG